MMRCPDFKSIILALFDFTGCGRSVGRLPFAGRLAEVVTDDSANQSPERRGDGL